MRPHVRLVALLAVLAMTPIGPGAGTAAAGGSVLAPFRGLGAWVDIYDPGMWRKAEDVVARLADRGVRTLYLETANWHVRGPIRFPSGAARFLRAAHAAGIRVVAWYVPGFDDLDRDLAWSLAAVRFRTRTGERFDGFGLDIEATIVSDPDERARRVLVLSRRLRDAVGQGYPLGAIVVSPIRSPSYWPVLPSRELARIFDVFMPMAYGSSRYFGEQATHDYIADVVRLTREQTERPTMPIHVIGGIADSMDRAEVRGFVRAVREHGVIGASLYDAKTSGTEDWDMLRQIEPGPVQRPAMPLVPWTHLGAYGNLTDGDRSHPREVVFRVGPRTGPWEIDLEAFDVTGTDEVRVLVNWRRVSSLPITGAGQWGPRSTVVVPDGLLSGERPNVIVLATGAHHPSWETWGVRAVTVVRPALSLEDRGDHGALPGTGRGSSDRVSYDFESDGLPMTVTVQGYDADQGEVVVVLNGAIIAELSPTPDDGWGPEQSVTLEPPDLLPGLNRLTFDSVRNPPSLQRWGVRVVEVSG